MKISFEQLRDLIYESFSNESSIMQEEDKKYMDAVNDDDMETAAKMVREAAAKAMPDTKVIDKDGLPRVMFHVTDNDFTVFNTSWRGIIFLATSESGAKRSAANGNAKTLKIFVNAKKIRGDKGPGVYFGDAENKQYQLRLRRDGYDGIKIRDEAHGTIAVFSSSQIKSADPVTYDDDGSIIPLSKRFDTKNPDIRY